MLVDAAGTTVRDPMTGMPLIVDQDFDMDRAIAFGRLLATIGTGDNPAAERAGIYAAMYFAFKPGGPLDMQRSYNGMVGGGGHEFVRAFRPAASYLLGVVGRAAGLTPQEIIAGAGLHYLWEKKNPTDPYPYLDTSGPMFNAPQNARWIEEGIRGHDSERFFQPSRKQDGGAGQLPADASEKINSNLPDNWIPPGQDSSDQGMPQNPADLGAADPQMPNRQFAGAVQPAGPRQVGSPTALNLPQHVIDTGNYLRANGIEITPRSMYVANVLGPRGAVRSDQAHGLDVVRCGAVPRRGDRAADADLGAAAAPWSRGAGSAGPRCDRSAGACGPGSLGRRWQRALGRCERGCQPAGEPLGLTARLSQTKLQFSLGTVEVGQLARCLSCRERLDGELGVC